MIGAASPRLSLLCPGYIKLCRDDPPANHCLSVDKPVFSTR